jgi:hypothetical protein
VLTVPSNLERCLPGHVMGGLGTHLVRTGIDDDTFGQERRTEGLSIHQDDELRHAPLEHKTNAAGTCQRV